MKTKELNKKFMIKKRSYGNLLHSDAIIILITIFISIICEIFFEANSNYDYLVLIIFNIMAICYDKEVRKKSLGVIMIISSLILIIESVIEFKSIFNLIFTILGIITIIHSICYLKKGGQKNEKR